MVKSLFISSNFNGKSGSSRAATDQLIATIKNSSETTVLSCTGFASVRDTISNRCGIKPTWLEVRQHFSNLGYGLRSPVIRVLKSARWKPTNYLAKRHLFARKFDLILINSISGDALCELFAKNTKGTRIFLLHGTPDVYTKSFCDRDEEHLRYSGILNKYDYIISPSEKAVFKWRECGLITDPDNIHIIPNCCNEDTAFEVSRINKEDLRADLGIPAGAFVVVCVGSLIKRKGQDLLLESLRNIAETIPNLKVFIIGGKVDGEEEYLQHLKALCHCLPVQFTGFRHDALKFIRAADLFVLPSRSEAMPLSILEAMCLDTPAIVSDIDGNPELIENEIDGLLVPPESPESIGKAIEKACFNPDMRLSMAQNAREKYWTNFSRASQLAAWQRALRRITEATKLN
jgi:glycosyltransferase involved in cell wall biosynthesis